MAVGGSSAPRLLRSHRSILKARESELGRLGSSLSLTEEEEAGLVFPTAPVNATDDPNIVNLNYYDFHIHIHGLPLGRMTKGVAFFIGNKLGKFKEVELDSNGEAWGSSIRIRVAIDITKPLKRALKIHKGICVPSNGKSGSLTLLWPRSVKDIWGTGYELEGSDLETPVSFACSILEGLALCRLSTVHERLDRVCANLGWSQLFPKTVVQYVPMNCFDHVALVVRLRDNIRHDTRGARLWRFEAAWLQWKECEKVVANSWTTNLGCTSEHGILACCQDRLKNWSKTTLQTDKNQVKLLDSKLRRLLREWVTPEVSDEIARIRLELEGIVAHDETRWKQRIKGMEHLRAVVDARMGKDLLQPYTTSEVKKTLFQMAPLKSPGPDGKAGWCSNLTITKLMTRLNSPFWSR
ncbi:hypothetical protein Sango_0385000 [Sesamum angolense]|uniref:Uncharacterized protein n=1 Tax=Sesamum angolense TaxID=2727404 RepID=A0AAE1XA17_9LAMI|nr:hypothetical protein Sango_0385000 [Sesamum angolense]